MALYNIMRQNKITKEIDFMPHNSSGSQYTKWIKVNSNICRRVMTENDADFTLNNMHKEDNFYYFKCLNNISSKTCEICNYGDNTGTNADLDLDIHKGFTVGNGKALYWEMLWTKNGHVRIFGKRNSPRWIDGGTKITIHFNP